MNQDIKGLRTCKVEITTPIEQFLLKHGPFDEVEIEACHMIDETNVEPCDIEEADFFSVYLHMQSGGVICVADCGTMEAAVDLKKLLYIVGNAYNPQSLDQISTFAKKWETSNR